MVFFNILRNHEGMLMPINFDMQIIQQIEFNQMKYLDLDEDDADKYTSQIRTDKANKYDPNLRTPKNRGYDLNNISKTTERDLDRKLRSDLESEHVNYRFD